MTIYILLNDHLTKSLCQCYGILLYVFWSRDTACTYLIKHSWMFILKLKFVCQSVDGLNKWESGLEMVEREWVSKERGNTRLAALLVKIE